MGAATEGNGPRGLPRGAVLALAVVAFAAGGVGVGFALGGKKESLGPVAVRLPTGPPASSPTSQPTSQPTRAIAVPSPPAATPVGNGQVTITAVGDIIMGHTPVLPPDGGRAFFDPVKPELTGDLVLGNLEGALTDQASSSKCPPGGRECYAFRMPPGYAQWLRGAGFTVLNLANNHSRDYGMRGLADTKAALTAHGLSYDGMPGQVSIQRAGGLTVAVLGFAPYGWTQSLLDIPAAQRLVREAKKQADLVFVTIHAGGEGDEWQHVKPGTETFLGENRGDSVRFAHAVVDAGADLLIGSGPHVLRGMEWYKGKLIAYSMGNFAGYKSLSTSGPRGIGGITHITLRADGTFVRGQLASSRMVGAGTPALDPSHRAVTTVRQLSTADFGHCAAQLSPTGTLSPPTC
ncbi:MAG: CapA family protein [Mycobacteriales bacterium]